MARLRRHAQHLEEERDRIFALSQDLICIAAMDGYFKYVSPSWKRVLGYSAEELLSRPFLEFIHPDDHALNDAEVARLAQGIQTVDFENRYVCQDGSIRHFLWAATPLVEEGLMYCIGRDITRRKRAEESLAETTQRLTVALHSGNIGLWDWDFLTGEAHYSPELKAQLGYGDNELANCVEEWESRLAPEDRARTLQTLHDYLNGRRPEYAVEFRLRHRDGSYRWIFSKGEATRDPSGGRNRMLGCHVDITDRKRTEEALTRNEEWFRALIELSASVYTVIDRDARIRYQSPTSEAWYGWTPEDVVGRTVFEFIHPDDMPRAEASLSKLLEKPDAVHAEELRFRHKDGSWRWNRVTGANRLDKPAVRGIVVTSQDIAELKRTEEELARAKDAAEAANRAKSEFLANMSHEIRTPMAAITGLTELLLSKQRPWPEQREHLQTIDRNARNLLAIINDILDLSKIEAKRIEVELANWSPRQVVEEVKALFDEKIREKNLSLEVEYVKPFPSTIHTDRGKLLQILVNLVGNAVKFTDAGGVRITVRHLSETGSVPQMRFEVTDTGIGISAEGMEDLFEPFTQADMSTTRRHGGTGLGLSISQRLAAMLGGRIDVASRPGAGSTFTLTIDAAAPEAPPARKASETEQPAVDDARGSCRGRVLLAEDSADMVKLIQYMLAKTSIQLDVAADGLAACNQALASRAAGTPYDLILMDIRMPALDGHEATRRLRAHGWTGPIVALTANAMRGDHDKCLQAGCDDFLAKPINRRAIQAVLRRYLGGYDPRREARRQSPDAGQASVAGTLFDGLIDDATANQLVQEYTDSLRLTAEALAAALTTQDRDQLAKLAHDLKGVAAMYGFPHVSAKARCVQQLAEEASDVRQMQATVTELIELCRAVVRESRPSSPPAAISRLDHDNPP